MLAAPPEPSIRHRYRVLSSVVLRGETDSEATFRGRKAVESCPLRPRPGIAIEMSALTFRDVSGLNVLPEAVRRGIDAGRRLDLRGLSPQVRRLVCPAAADRVLLVPSSGRRLLRAAARRLSYRLRHGAPCRISPRHGRRGAGRRADDPGGVRDQ
ncbi:STAS domain-containing protein [Streptomyces xanthochromogenes]|uniref:STAS domain-containing protein n=1 Tax=Streptomyces xanthochromogenes TaxID=67384 RepID=UPI00343491CB